MDRAALEARRAELVEDQKRMQAALLRLQGALVLIDEMLEEQTDGD